MQHLKVLNLTPHAVSVRISEDRVKVFPKVNPDKQLRLEESYPKVVLTMSIEFGLPVIEALEYQNVDIGALNELVENEGASAIIVPKIVADKILSQAAPIRFQIFSPNTGTNKKYGVTRDENGIIRHVQSLCWHTNT